MAKAVGPKCRVCRRNGVKLFLKGTRCETAKCPMEKEAQPPGMTKRRRPRLTEYGLHLREVQRVKKHYGLMYRQFRRYFEEAARQPGNTGDHLIQSLETRLDAVLYRLRLSTSRSHGRQLILHGHVLVNGKKVTIPSMPVKAGDVIEPGKTERSRKAFQEAYAMRKDVPLPSWLKVDEEPLRGTVLQLPGLGELQMAFEPRLVVEYMAR